MADRAEEPAQERGAAADLAGRPGDAPGGAPASDQPAAGEPPRGRRLARSTAIFSLATALSRVVGLFREVVVRRYFGVQGEINLFTVAFQVPNLIRALVADTALSSAFVPVFSELLERNERARAWRVASTLFWLMLLGLTGITALFILLAPWVMRPFGYEGEDADLVVGLSRVLFPIVVLLGLSGLVVGILNSYEHFTVPALTPVFWNVAIIVALVVGVPLTDDDSTQLYIYAGGIVAGTVIQLLLPVPWLRGRDGRLRMAIDVRDPAVKQVFAHMLPVALGIGLINFNLLIGTFFAARLIDPLLAPASIDAAFRIYMLPQGMFSVAVATVLFPRLSRLAARGDGEGFRETVSLGIRQIGFMLIPASVVLAVLAEPIVRLLYQRGEFNPSQTPVVAGALAAFTIGLAFNGMMLMLNRAFFSLQSPWIPTWIALGNLTLNAALAYALSPLGVWGIPLATSICNIAGTAALVWVFRRLEGRLGGRQIVDAYARTLAASALAGGAAYGVWFGLDEALGRELGFQLISVTLGIAVATAVFLGAARILRIRELEALVSLVRRPRPSA
jgi:putative peptidoglycan lipid II flippase